MELKEKLTQFNTVLFALQVEITKVSDKAIGEKLQSLLFCMQMGLAQMYREMTDNFDQREKRPSNNDEHIASQPPQFALDCNCGNKKSENGLLKFNDKEIFKMPKTFRKEFRAQGCTAHVRKRTDGRYKCSYEIRYNRNGYKISASATTLEKAKERFIEKLNTVSPINGTTAVIPNNFDDFASYWFINFHKRKVCERTYDHDIKLYNRHIKELYGKLNINKLNAVMLQALLDSFADRPKTAQDIYSILNQIFACAVKHGLIKLNPIGMCFRAQYDKEHGKLISKEEERKVLTAYAGTSYQIYFAVVFYTGLRPSEYTSAIIEGNFIKARNNKRKDGKIDYKRIPITPMLRPYLHNITQLDMPKPRVLNNRFKKVLPNNKLYDMRTTFQTRCSECGIPDNVIGIFMGNSIGKLKDAYTDFSDEYLLRESKKLNY